MKGTSADLVSSETMIMKLMDIKDSLTETNIQQKQIINTDKAIIEELEKKIVRLENESHIIYHDKALGDGDIVASLEAEIKDNQEKMRSNFSDGDMSVRKIVDKLLCRILDTAK